LRQAFVQRVQCFGAVRGLGRPLCTACNAFGRSEDPAGVCETPWGRSDVAAGLRATPGTLLGRSEGAAGLCATRGMLRDGPMIRQAFVKRLGDGQTLRQAFVQYAQCFGAIRVCGSSQVAAGLRATRATLWGGQRLQQAFVQLVHVVADITHNLAEKSTETPSFPDG